MSFRGETRSHCSTIHKLHGDVEVGWSSAYSAYLRTCSWNDVTRCVGQDHNDVTLCQPGSLQVMTSLCVSVRITTTNDVTLCVGQDHNDVTLCQPGSQQVMTSLCVCQQVMTSLCVSARNTTSNDVTVCQSGSQ